MKTHRIEVTVETEEVVRRPPGRGPPAKAAASDRSWTPTWLRRWLPAHRRPDPSAATPDDPNAS